jgi:endonuclease YncB( thermonuclease family)
MEFNDNAPLFSLNNIETDGKIVSVYDGDSCDIVLHLDKLGCTRFKCRLNGIDCAERKSKNESEKQHALKALEFVKGWQGVPVRVKCYKFDKYGRLLVDVFCSNESLAEKLVENGLAYRYCGKTKKSFEEWHCDSKASEQISKVKYKKNRYSIKIEYIFPAEDNIVILPVYFNYRSRRARDRMYRELKGKSDLS